MQVGAEDLDGQRALQTGGCLVDGVFGGLGEVCASALMQQGISVPFRIVGIPDEDTVTGDQYEIFDHYGISAEGLAATARNLLETALSR